MMRIDPHVHLRDGEYESHKETLSHGFYTAWEAGISGVFEMPNTNPPLTSERAIKERIKAADTAREKLEIPLFHGILAGLTSDEKQIREVVAAWKKLFPRVCGLKMFAGHSTGNMGIIEPRDQAEVYSILAKENFTGVLMVHCEKEALLKPEAFNPLKPETHLDARPPEAEVESIRDQLKAAEEAGFRGTLHICHISVPESLNLIEESRERLPFKVSCGITPHHALFSVSNMMKEEGLLLKVNPPLRSKEMQKQMLKALLEERITWIETDHAPHTREEKLEKHYSGIPGLQFYSTFIEILKKYGLDEETLHRLCFKNIVETFGLPDGLFTEKRKKKKKPPPGLAPSRMDYGFDPFNLI